MEQSKAKKPKKTSKVQGFSYWEKRPQNDEQRDWGTESSNWIGEYWGSQSHPHRDLILSALHNVGDFESVLEIGCNAGANLNRIQTEFPGTKLFGVDINADALAFVSSMVGGTFYYESATKLTLGDKSVDIVLSDAVLIYADPTEAKKIIKEMTRVAKKAIILVEFGADKESVVDYHYARDYAKLFEKTGFELVEKHKITPEEWHSKNWSTNGYLWLFRQA